MAFRFRKSKNIGGLRINLSKSGIGYSLGCKGFRWTKKANGGTRKTLSIPGTGISYVTEDNTKTANILKPFGLLGKIILFPFWFPFWFMYFTIKWSIKLIKWSVKAVKWSIKVIKDVRRELNEHEWQTR